MTDVETKAGGGIEKMVQLVKWYPDQVASKWGVIGPAIEFTLPPITSSSEERMNKVLESILCGRLVVYAGCEENEKGEVEFLGIITTSIIEISDGTERSLLIYSLYGEKRVTLVQVNEVFELLKKVAKVEDCQSISAYTTVEPLVAMCKRNGWNTNFTFMKLEV